MRANGIVSGNSSNWLVPFVFLILFVVFYATAIPLMDDNDVPWHIAAGKLIWQTHLLPKTDPWSFASNGAPWYLLSWLWDMLLGGIEQCFGLFGVLIFVLSLSAGLIAMLAAQLLRLRIALPAVFFTLLLAGLCMLDFITARPQLGGYALALVFHAVLSRSRDDAQGRRLYWLPPLMILWANMHGSFIAGFTILGAHIIEAFFARKFGWLRRLLAVSAACIIAALLNPYGIGIMSGAMKSLHADVNLYTIEWLPFSFSASVGVSSWLIVFIMASNLRGSLAAIADKILAIAWLVAAMFAMRDGAIFILLSAPYLATCLDEATQGLRSARAPSAFMEFMARRTLRQVWLTAAGLFALLVAAMQALPHEDKIVSADRSVADAIDFVTAHYPGERFLTDYNYSGQVIYRAAGKIPFMVDSRAGTAYAPQVLSDYVDFMWQRPGWEEKISAYGVRGILIDSASRFSKNYADGQYRGHWKLVFAGKNANVYIARP